MKTGRKFYGNNLNHSIHVRQYVRRLSLKVILFIHVNTAATFAYTPGASDCPHPYPHDDTPINIGFPSSSIVVNGPKLIKMCTYRSLYKN